MLVKGEISEALGRGKHTTRHVMMIPLFDGFILDSPGFSALDFYNMRQIEIRDAFIEFAKYSCLFDDCMHITEDNCHVKDAVEKGLILKSRYDNYLSFIKTAYNESEKYKRR